MYVHRGDLVDIGDMTLKFEGILGQVVVGEVKPPMTFLTPSLPNPFHTQIDFAGHFNGNIKERYA